MAVVTKKCNYSNTSKITLFDFYSRHVDDWNNNTETPGQILNPSDEKNHEQITQQQLQQHRQRRTSADVIGKKKFKTNLIRLSFIA